MGLVLSSSARLYGQACRYLVAGVNSPVRAFKAVGGSPLFIKRGKGPYIIDADNNRYIDYVMSWGALILGHTHPSVSSAVKNALRRGASFGAPTENEIVLSKIISCAIPSIKMLRLVNSGTEATMSAIRLSRGFTGRSKIIKFSGSYHGHSDSLLVKAGSGAATFGVPDSLGVPVSITKDTIVLPYNDIDKLAFVIRKKHKEIACVITEPVCANMGVVRPKKNFLSDLRELTAKHKIILIFDEVISGFRFCFGGAQDIYGIKPDLTCLGKIIGGGLPIGAYGGRKEIMEFLSPLGGVYQAGTLSGNPLAVASGIAALKALSKLDYKVLNQRTESLCRQMGDVLRYNGIDFALNQAGSLFTIFFRKGEVFDYDTARGSDIKKYAKFFWLRLRKGVYLPPSQFEANFLSFAHKRQDLSFTLSALKGIAGRLH